MLTNLAACREPSKCTHCQLMLLLLMLICLPSPAERTCQEAVSSNGNKHLQMIVLHLGRYTVARRRRCTIGLESLPQRFAQQEGAGRPAPECKVARVSSATLQGGQQQQIAALPEHSGTWLAAREAGLHALEASQCLAGSLNAALIEY